MKYEAKNVGGVATSQAAGAPWLSISQLTAITTSSAACTGCHLITEAEYLTIAQNVLGVASNWSTGTVGSGFIYSVHTDNAPSSALAADTNDSNGYYGTGNVSPSNQRRTLTLSNGEVIWDLAGNVYEWTSGQTTGGQPGITGESAFDWKEWNATPMTTASFSPSGPNPFPSYGTPAASGWNAGTNGIGRLYSHVGDSALRGFLRGGNWINGSSAGVLALALSFAPSSTNTYIGFRVSR
jgi:formylglycine-generating enzyme required for sulfatase activity